MVSETEDVKRIKEVSEEISGWEEVIDFQLVHFNGEDMTGNDDQKGDGP